MKYIATTMTIIILFTVNALAADENKNLLIVEISTANSNSASAEYVEIYNPNNKAMDMGDYSLEYLSSTGDKWSKKGSSDKKIGPFSRMLFATKATGYNNSESLSSGLAASGGHVRISNNDKTQDLVGWGTALNPETEVVDVHDKNQSIKRLVDEDGKFIDSNNNFKDLFISDSPTPENNLYIEDILKPSDPASTTKPKQQSQTSASNIQYPQIALNELFIDPKSPLTDKEDEFIELFNPHNFVVDLTGYQVQSGTNWRYKYEIESGVIQPGSYLVLYSADSGLTLSNSGSQVRILDPSGKLVDGVSYEKAKAGYVLARKDDKWQWSNEPTPNQQNIVSLDSGEGSSEEDSDNLPHVAGLSSSGSSGSSELKAPDDSEDQNTINNRVLVIVGVLAVLYGLYEYRQDIRNKLSKLRGHYRNWSENRKKPKRRGSDRASGRRWFRQDYIRARFGSRSR